MRSQQTIKKVRLNIFTGAQGRKKVPLMFWKPKDSMKGISYVFSGYKEINNQCLGYLENKLEQDSHGWCIWNLNLQKSIERTYLETSKQERRYRLTHLEISKKEERCDWNFWMPNESVKGKCYIFRGTKQSNKLSFVYLECKLQEDRYDEWIFKIKY